jgi:FkbM family methyltransferase
VARPNVGVPARLVIKVRLAACLVLFYFAQITSGARRRRLLARAQAMDPTGGLALLDLARRGTVGDLIADTKALLRVLEPEGAPGHKDLPEDVLYATVVARVDPKLHPRAHLAQRFAAYLLQAPRSASPSQLAQDLFVTFALGERRGAGFFVEFGAGDGVELSNTYRLERDLGWSGIAAEPNPVQHEALRRNRRCAVSDRCVWARSGERLTFSVLDAAPEFSTLTPFQAGDKHDRRGARSIEVQTLTLEDLLREHGAPRRIDYVSVDTEGSELAILEAFDFDAFDVSVLTVEHNFGPGRAALHRLLTGRGYVRLLEEFSRWDDWYVKADVARRLETRPESA